MKPRLQALAPHLLLLLLALATGLPLPAAARAAAPAAMQSACSWNAPGHDPFTGDVVAAVDAYRDIPAATRARLQQRMASRAYDEVVRIRRDGIEGRRGYRSEIRDMHFGSGRRCATVDRSAWPAAAEERGLVYCEAGHCILVPTVCRNVSRIQPAEARAGSAPDAGSAPPPALLAAVAEPAPGGQQAAGPADAAALPLSQVMPVAQAVPSVAVSSVAGAAAGGADDGGETGLSPAFAPPPPRAGSLLDAPGWIGSPVVTPSAVPAPVATVPEPAGPLPWLAGLLVLAACRRRFRA